MEYRYLKARGALNEAAQVQSEQPAPLPRFLLNVPAAVIGLIPASLARENAILPVALDGETLTVAAASADNIVLADKLSFLVNKKVRLVAVPREQLRAAIAHHYPATRTESVDSMLQEFTDTAIDFTDSTDFELSLNEADLEPATTGSPLGRISALQRNLSAAAPPRVRFGEDPTRPLGGSSMFFHVVEEGQRVLMRRPDGTMSVVIGPARVWIGRNIFHAMRHYVAHPAEFLIIRYRDGRQEHVVGPADIWFDPRVHQEITRQDALALAAKEAVVVYSKGRSGEPSRTGEGDTMISRRIVYGPAQFTPQPGEWLHTFSWHASKGGHLGVEKVPNGLVFQKLWLMPDQMYHDVNDVRTADDAVLTVRLMIFFELADIERMLDTTHDPIGDFVNAATSDVVAFTGRHNFESFKQNVPALNELEMYRQLTARAGQCGYRINKVVFRGYGAPAALQQMHDQAIQARTKLQLDRATEQQAQDLENYRLDAQIARASKRRTEQSTELEHELELSRRRQENQLTLSQRQDEQQRQERRLEAEQQLDMRRRGDAEQREHLAVLRDMGVDLTAFLTQARADRVIELRGSAAEAHVHLEPAGNGKTST
ncbi:MAG: hypothetical protein L0Y71_24110 [Gemmataceae bacterium]|nr:hypothetical protein [Gemmataceae bacterium]